MRFVLAADASEALQLLESNVFDLALVDLVMPAIDGAELCRRIRAAPGYTNLPLIVMSALDEKDILASSSREVGGVAWLAKPFSPPALLEKVSAVLASAQSSGPTKDQRGKIT